MEGIVCATDYFFPYRTWKQPLGSGLQIVTIKFHFVLLSFCASSSSTRVRCNSGNAMFPEHCILGFNVDASIVKARRADDLSFLPSGADVEGEQGSRWKLIPYERYPETLTSPTVTQQQIASDGRKV